MTTPAAPRVLKRFGQHFLIDQNIVRKIVAAAALGSTDTVLEIGPGRGVLTKALCAAARRVIAVELDSKLGAYLAGALADCGNLELRIGDALTFPYETLPKGTVVVANLPYYVSTPLLFRLFEVRDRLDRLVLMLQMEVARRLVATPGSADYGVLSVLAQFFSTPALAFSVSRHCFRPKPAVESAVVTLTLRGRRPVSVRDEEAFIRTVRAAFAHRRKTIANSLRDEGWAPEAIRRALETAGVQPSRRAETLSLLEFAAVADALGEAG
ncbi:16S rRNA (adenine(1518)-N(6)/adenine(1519)-N(6))-dimethyltransferase RsmA [Nitrospira sp. Kam-Ns4a]